MVALVVVLVSALAFFGFILALVLVTLDGEEDDGGVGDARRFLVGLARVAGVMA